MLFKNDSEVRLRSLDVYPRYKVATLQTPRLMPAKPTGIGETTPVDPLRYAH